MFYSFGGEPSPVFFFCVHLSVMTFVSTTFSFTCVCLLLPASGVLLEIVYVFLVHALLLFLNTFSLLDTGYYSV